MLFKFLRSQQFTHTNYFIIFIRNLKYSWGKITCFSPQPLKHLKLFENIYSALGCSNSSTLVSTPPDTEIQNRAVSIFKSFWKERTVKTPLGNILDIDNDSTLYNIKKWVCIYTLHKMCQNNGSLKPMAVKLKHAGPKSDVKDRFKKHPSVGDKQAGQVGSGFLGRAGGR